MELLALERWLHFLAGITWIGLLYYFNFVQVPALAEATADKAGPGPAAISKYVAPRALLWFRWAAVVTWLSGALYLLQNGQFMNAVTLGIGQTNPYATYIGIGAWLGTIMLINVWGLIWPNQKKILGWVEATDEQKTKARRVPGLAHQYPALPSHALVHGSGESRARVLAAGHRAVPACLAEPPNGAAWFWLARTSHGAPLRPQRSKHTQ